ncbi:MAG: alpha-1,2-fucosyltransferase [Candidatus Paceibacterota bacterium]
MIITAFKGQLGNQLFQYAAARKFAHDSHTEIKLDLRSYVNVMDALKIRFFNIKDVVATESECKKLKNKDFLYYLERLIPYYRRRFVWEKNWAFDKNLIGIKRKNMYIRGIFQSPKYFEGIEDILREEFKLKQSIDLKYKDEINAITNTNSVSIHIRRGDIMLGNVKFEKPTTSVDYYEKAVDYISKNTSNPHYFVFSDDIKWAKENLNFINPVTFVSRKEITDYEELSIMSRCKHNIIGNSTFSWWGAWLNANPNKIVINPKKWFIDPVMNAEYTKHLILKSWITI